jgi:hypothetical protein
MSCWFDTRCLRSGGNHLHWKHRVGLSHITLNLSEHSELTPPEKLKTIIREPVQ